MRLTRTAVSVKEFQTQLEQVSDRDLMAIAISVGEQFDDQYEAFLIQKMTELDAYMNSVGMNYREFAKMVVKGGFNADDKYFVYTTNALRSFKDVHSVAEYIRDIGLDQLADVLAWGYTNVDELLNDMK